MFSLSLGLQYESDVYKLCAANSDKMSDDRGVVRVGSAGIVENGSGEILMALRGTYPSNIWVLPGGGVNFGERASDAFAREILEETGIEIGKPELIKVLELILPERDIHRVIFFHKAKSKGGELRPSDDVTEIRWMSVKEILKTKNVGDAVLPILRAAGYIG